MFRDRFLIADIHMQSDFPTERWFWFDPPFHPGQSVLLHRQADDVWRIDFQLGWDADPERGAQAREHRAAPARDARAARREFEIEWASVYTFQCRRMQRFRHGRVLFAGDAAHLVSPFGARGANSGVQDADNLAWKLELVVRGAGAGTPARHATTASAARPPTRTSSHSTRSTDFITPKSAMSRMFRDAVLELATHHAFARRLVNSGRLSVPAVLRESPLNTPDCGRRISRRANARWLPGACAVDAPVAARAATGCSNIFAMASRLLAFGAIVPAAQTRELSRAAIRVSSWCRSAARQVDGIEQVEARDGLLARRYDGGRARATCSARPARLCALAAIRRREGATGDCARHVQCMKRQPGINAWAASSPNRTSLRPTTSTNG